MRNEKSGSTIKDRLEYYSVPEPNTGCLLWIAASTFQGYGRIKVGNKLKYAHRVSWFEKFGEIPKNMYVLHNCDTPECINPNHLRLGTHVENMNDMKVRKRKQNSFCKKMHPLIGKNLGTGPSGRYCKRCAADRKKKYRKTNVEPS